MVTNLLRTPYGIYFTKNRTILRRLYSAWQGAGGIVWFFINCLDVVWCPVSLVQCLVGPLKVKWHQEVFFSTVKFSLKLSYFNNLFLWKILSNFFINVYIIACENSCKISRELYGVWLISYNAGQALYVWAWANVIIYRRQSAPVRCVTTQEKNLKNRPVPGRLSNLPVMCRSLKSYYVRFISDHKICWWFLHVWWWFVAGHTTCMVMICGRAYYMYGGDLCQGILHVWWWFVPGHTTCMMVICGRAYYMYGDDLCQGMLHGALQYRQQKAGIYEADPESGPEFRPWTAGTGPAGTRTLLLRQVISLSSSGFIDKNVCKAHGWVRFKKMSLTFLKCSNRRITSDWKDYVWLYGAGCSSNMTYVSSWMAVIWPN